MLSAPTLPAVPIATPSAADVSVLELLQQVEQGLAALPLGQQEPATLYQPMQYLLGLKAKRMRPLLVLLGYQACINGTDSTPSRALPTALSVELFHNFTLMHDDIMDNAPTRRGMPTVHTKWDSNVAILSGDGMFAYSMLLVAQTFPEHAHDLVRIYSQAALAVCEGQMRDMDLAARPGTEVTVPEYLEMIGQKTAALLGASLRLGACAAGADEATQLHFERFGILTGIAFQLQDDLLDVFAPATTGKQPAGDIIENKKTYLWLRALEKATPAQRNELLRWTTISDRNEEKVAAVLAIYNQLGIAAETQQVVDRYFAEALTELAGMEDRPAVQQIETLLAQLIQRVS